ncbi:unnamed protein product [Adineta ricciae]|uniref:G-protein coupled receptors family 1 profile domain-containing protein n=1 Tax=Adineta ricciae TaxID=249248 RepID=A0A814V8M7_ADIRI|nr:unnamed protein product [Adineta ricciae]CAF1513890.1 unnamed protein product [Adineta ricciae]
MSQQALAQQIRFIGEKYRLYAGIFNLIIGIISNISIIVVFTTLRLFRANQTAFYFIAESISNIGLLLTLNIPKIFTAFINYDPAQSSVIWCKLQTMLLQAFALFSLFNICFLSFDQYLSTNARATCRQKSTLKLAHRLTSFNVCFVILHGVTALIFTEIQSSMGCNVYNPIARRYYTFFYYPILANSFPLTFILTSSLLAYRNVRRIIRLQQPVFRRRLDSQLTAMTLARVIVLGICGFPYIIISLYQLNLSITADDYMKIAIITLLSIIFASLLHVNFTVN